MRGFLIVPAAGLMVLAALSCPAAAQDAEAAPEAPAEAAPAPRKPKPHPKPRPKPQATPAETPAETPAAAKAADPPPEAPAPDPAFPPVPAPATAMLAAALPVACEKGEAVRYEASGGVGKAPNTATAPIELWVTRSGLITIDNPLRPLTPDVTRVLQVVIGAKVATAYGPDLQSLRRGAGPAVLEGVIGGAIRWDAGLVALPDPLPILSDSGDVLAAFAFRACGTAPTARTLAAPKPRRTAPPTDAAGLAPDPGKETAKQTGKEGRPARRTEPRPDAAPRAPAVPLPQGAIP